MNNDSIPWLEDVNWNDAGLVAAVAQDVNTNRVLMMAWMDKQALQQTLATRQATYWSRSRQAIWQKGEQSGNTQLVKQVYLDCDGDTILLKVEQQGGIACHTGRESCFYRVYNDEQWRIVDEVIKQPSDMYGKYDK